MTVGVLGSLGYLGGFGCLNGLGCWDGLFDTDRPFHRVEEDRDVGLASMH